MGNYRRIYLPKHSYFFTVVTANRKPVLAEDENIQILKKAFHYVKQRKPFNVDAVCILPDHLHCIWSVTEDSNYSIRWQMIKTNFSILLRHHCPGLKNSKIWQPRFWEHTIRDKDDMHRHIDYIHYNPVKHGLVKSAKEWRYSSFGKYLDQGFYEKGWGESEPETIVGMQLD